MAPCTAHSITVLSRPGQRASPVGGTPHHFASSIFVFFLVRDRLFRSTDPGAWHTRHRHWDVEWVEGRSADDGMSPKALASLGSRSPRTVSHGRQPALRVLRCAPVLRMTAATDRARSPCGPAGKAGPRSTACKCDACEPLRCRGTPSTTPGRDPRVPSRLRAAAMGHPDTKATGRGLRDPLILPYEINKNKPFLNRHLALEEFARWRTLN